jgi:leucyl-tRNA synthetase
VFGATWPAFDERLAASGDVEIAVQVNGKVRARLTVPRGLGETQVRDLALKDQAVRKFVDGKAVKKAIYVQDRLLNLVV